MFTAYHAKYFAQELTLQHAADGVDRLSQSLFDASVDLNPHQIEAALVLWQYWAERKRYLLVICPASLRKQFVAMTPARRHRSAMGSEFFSQAVSRKLLCPHSTGHGMHRVALPMFRMRHW